MSWVEQPPHVPPLHTPMIRYKVSCLLKNNYYRSRIMKQVDSSKCEVSNKQKGNVLAV